jgi:hypothetical protein
MHASMSFVNDEVAILLVILTLTSTMATTSSQLDVGQDLPSVRMLEDAQNATDTGAEEYITRVGGRALGPLRWSGNGTAALGALNIYS